VIALDQVEIDGVRDAQASAIFVGSHLRWAGDAVRIDGPGGLLTLAATEGADDVRRRASRSVRRLLGDLAAPRAGVSAQRSEGHAGPGFTVTDGRANYWLMLAGQGRLLAVSGALPPRDADLVVVEAEADLPVTADLGTVAGVICFAVGTLLLTPEGLRPVEAIRAGDRVSTRDSGAQEVLWSAHQRFSGARLFAMPHLRPIRIHSGALGEDRPEGDLLVSPEHRLLLRGNHARDLFNEPELLVAARDLVDGHTIRPVSGLKEVTYVHLLTPRHEIVWANGVEAETFHPAGADLDLFASADRAALCGVAPGLVGDPFAYGGFARRALSAREATILRFAAA
jgi:hypothetical protein